MLRPTHSNIDGYNQPCIPNYFSKLFGSLTLICLAIHLRDELWFGWPPYSEHFKSTSNIQHLECFVKISQFPNTGTPSFLCFVQISPEVLCVEGNSSHKEVVKLLSGKVQNWGSNGEGGGTLEWREIRGMFSA